MNSSKELPHGPIMTRRAVLKSGAALAAAAGAGAVGLAPKSYPFTGIQEATEIRSAVSVLGDTSVRTEGKGVRISEEGAGS